MVFAPGDLFVLLLDFELLFGEVFADKNDGDVLLFGLPVEQSLNITLNDAFVVHVVLKFQGWDFLKVLDVMLSGVLIEKR